MSLSYDRGIDSWQGSLPQYGQNYNAILGDYGNNLTLGQLISMSRDIRESMNQNRIYPGNQGAPLQSPTVGQIPGQVATALMSDQGRLLSSARRRQAASGGARSSFEEAPSLIENARGGSAKTGGFSGFGLARAGGGGGGGINYAQNAPQLSQLRRRWQPTSGSGSGTGGLTPAQRTARGQQTTDFLTRYHQ